MNRWTNLVGKPEFKKRPKFDSHPGKGDFHYYYSKTKKRKKNK